MPFALGVRNAKTSVKEVQPVEQYYQNKTDDSKSRQIKEKIIDKMRHMRIDLENKQFETASLCLRDVINLCREERDKKPKKS